MAQNLFGPPSTTPTAAPQAAPARTSSTPSRIVSSTRSAVGSVFGTMWRHKGKIALLAAAGAIYYYTDGRVAGLSRVMPRCSCSHPGISSVMPPILLPSSAGVREDSWQAGVNLVRQADQVDIEWRAALDRDDHSRDSEFIDRRTTFSRQSLDQYAVSLDKRSDESWEDVIRRRHRDLDIVRIRQVAFSLWRIGEYTQARGVMRFFFFDGRWKDLSNDFVCAGLDLALRENMLTLNEFNADDNNEFRRRCSTTLDRYPEAARR